MLAKPLNKNISENDIYIAIGRFIKRFFDGEVIKGQENRVSLPSDGETFILMQLIGRKTQSTNTHRYDPEKGVQFISKSAVYTLQMDCYGKDAATYSDAICTLLVDAIGSAYFRETHPYIAPIFTSGCRNLSFINQANQYENRWSFDLKINVLPEVSAPQSYFDRLAVVITNIGEKI